MRNWFNKFCCSHRFQTAQIIGVVVVKNVNIATSTYCILNASELACRICTGQSSDLDKKVVKLQSHALIHAILKACVWFVACLKHGMVCFLIYSWFIHFRHSSLHFSLLRWLKLLSSILYQIFIFSPNDSPSKTIKKVFFISSKIYFRSWNIQIFVISSLPFHTFQIQKYKWKWNNLWCYELVCINLQM